MKKIAKFILSVMRALILMAPGIAFLVWNRHTLGMPVNILAAVGLEMIFLMLWVGVSLVWLAARQVRSERRKKKEEGQTDQEP